MKNYCTRQNTCKHGDVCEAKTSNDTYVPMCYDKVEESDELFSEVKRDEPKNFLLF
jgi:hypothetical protein